jgi:hypothetical protein
MADYVRYRMAAAKLGVTVALLGLIQGVAAKVAGAEQKPANAHEAAASNFLKLEGLSASVANAFLKIELKLDQTVSSIDRTLSKSYLKLKTADSTFLKLRTANSTFLKIDAANSSFLKIDSANTTFLKIDDANNRFLKIDSPAANSQKLGGLTPDAFFHGKGNVLTNELTNVTADDTPLLSDGSLAVLVSPPPLMTPGNGSVTLENGTGADMVATYGENTLTVPANGTASAINLSGHQIDIQVFDPATPGKVWTITLSEVVANTGTVFTGQMLIGNVG